MVLCGDLCGVREDAAFAEGHRCGIGGQAEKPLCGGSDADFGAGDFEDAADKERSDEMDLRSQRRGL
jgi:hypothetical protein